MLILVDLDGTVRNFWSSYTAKAKYVAPDIVWPEDGPEKYWFLTKYFGHPRLNQLHDIWLKKNFFLHMEPYPDAVQSVMDLAVIHTVFLITAPMHDSPTAHSENAEWVRQYFGEEWANERLIQTPDRTFLSADILIDDNPQIMGVNKYPSWQQIVYAQPYNMHVCAAAGFGHWSQVRQAVDFVERKLKREEFINEHTGA